jgi:uncharacterized membrane protein YgdD (TMEM256/DUF423 family)
MQVFLTSGFLLAGIALAFLSVSLGAFGTHRLKKQWKPKQLEIFEIGVHYQMIHALGLILLGLTLTIMSQSILVLAGLFLFFGTLFFSGSLYLLATMQTSFWGVVTPIGGLFLLVGWLCYFIGVWQHAIR